MTTLDELRINVTAVNTVLGKPYVDDNGTTFVPKVTDMSPIILLRNCHPSFRSDFAHRLFKENIITEDEAIEFTKIVKSNQ